MLSNIISVVIAYILGSLQVSVLLSKFLKFPDPRTHGSHSTGATNVLRTVGTNQAILTLIGDFLKGFIAVLIAIVLHANPFFVAMAALAVVIGHIFPCFFQFRGGKGVATGLGGLIVLAPLVALIGIVLWLVIVYMSRYVSFASIIVAAAAPILILIFSPERWSYFIPILLMSALIIGKHSANIQRLRKGTEPKIKLNSPKSK
jgi:acyl phosphate:glycerol-3-phosphate acyltransferase